MNNAYSAKKAAMILLNNFILGANAHPAILTRELMKESLAEYNWKVTETRHKAILHQVNIIVAPFQERIAHYVKSVNANA